VLPVNFLPVALTETLALVEGLITTAAPVTGKKLAIQLNTSSILCGLKSLPVSTSINTTAGCFVNGKLSLVLAMLSASTSIFAIVVRFCSVGLL